VTGLCLEGGGDLLGYLGEIGATATLVCAAGRLVDVRTQVAITTASRTDLENLIVIS
jgi:hypothetical protein